ncbi:MAG: GlsB/YeaQ/YmgE family stress response membrane protein [Erythrobacter sp.]|uniref:GlsB/YeaQ/YmgE family stress response membrane protein n=1 Tax=Erythrobacter sp. TaxID=1042 RepID=UPI00261C0DDE|nr:GlsB/YeaQ/YmgE family stress response membrane protein [Erythrobacter sp.]MDJ0978382.1 GlsB/YeaQ/YmgE family stress response membrane protein [Erythrobacter sp.]
MGGVIGWLASMVMNRDAQMGLFWNIVVGIVGSFIGNRLFSFFGGSSIATLTDWRSLLAGFLGAVILLGAVNLVQRGKLR